MILKPGPVASEFIYMVANGLAREIGVYGPRGESKTVSALTAMIAHAQNHIRACGTELRQRIDGKDVPRCNHMPEDHDATGKCAKCICQTYICANYGYPVKWIGITDYHSSHKAKTVESLKKPFWEGGWQMSDDDHLATFYAPTASGDRVPLVVLSLFGIEDQGAEDRARVETCGVWADEVAPATFGHGVPESAWITAISSQRIPTHARVAFFTSNYPEENHWSWKRMKPNVGLVISRHPDVPNRACIRIPKGDNPHISDEIRDEWREAMKDRPDLTARLLDGLPGSVQRGKAVAVKYVDGKPTGFNEGLHVSPSRIQPVKSEPVYIGQDFGLNPATIIGQVIYGQVRVLAALVPERGGAQQQYELNVIPWLKKNAPWVIGDMSMVIGCYDPALPTDQSNSDSNPLLTITKLLDGYYDPGPVDWPTRENLLFSALNKSVPGSSFEPAVIIDPIDGDILVRALRGGWHYATDRYGEISREKPRKTHPDSDAGDAFVYLLCAALPEIAKSGSTRKKAPTNTVAKFDPRFEREEEPDQDEAWDARS